MLNSGVLGILLICIIFMQRAAAKFASLNEPCTNSLFCLGDKICNENKMCVCPENQVPTPDDTCKPSGTEPDKVPIPTEKDFGPSPINAQSFVVIEPTYVETTATKNPHFPGKAKPGQLCSFEVSCTGKSRCFKGHCHCLSGYKIAGGECVVYQQLPQRLVAWPIFGRQQIFRRWN